MLASHRLTVLMGFVLIAFVLTMILFVIARTLRIKFASLVLRASFRRFSNIAIFGSFVVALAAILIVGGVLARYRSGQVSVVSGIISEATNFVFRLTRSCGFLSMLVPVGIVVDFCRHPKDVK